MRREFLSVCLALGVAACQPAVDRTRGAIVPEGFGELRKGMTQAEVLQVLGSRYEVQHSLDQNPGEPFSDFFPYDDAGVTRYIEVSYENDRVLTFYYGRDHTWIE